MSGCVEEQMDAKRQLQEEQHERQLESAAAQAGLGAEGPESDAFSEEKAKYLETLIDSDIDPGTIRSLNNLLSRDFVLGNLARKDFHEFKWLARLRVKALLMEYPSPRSEMTGKSRAIAYGDPSDRKGAVSAEDETKIDIMTWGFISRLTRSIDGEQLEQLSKTTTHIERSSETETESEGGLLSGGGVF